LEKNNEQTVHSTVLLGVFLPFVHVVKILIFLVCIVAGFKLSCV